MTLGSGLSKLPKPENPGAYAPANCQAAHREASPLEGSSKRAFASLPPWGSIACSEFHKDFGKFFLSFCRSTIVIQEN